MLTDRDIQQLRNDNLEDVANEIEFLRDENQRLKISKQTPATICRECGVCGTKNRQQALDILLLLSAIESWSYSAGERMPDYLYDNLAVAVDVLSKLVMAGTTQGD